MHFKKIKKKINIYKIYDKILKLKEAHMSFKFHINHAHRHKVLMLLGISNKIKMAAYGTITMSHCIK